MKRAVAVLTLSAWLASGCTRGQATVGFGVGLGVLAYGAVLGASANGETGLSQAMDGLMLGGVGGALALGSLIALAATPSAPASASADDETEPPGPEHIEPRERALELLKQADAAAYANDCTTVMVRKRQIRLIDPEFHDTVFMKHVAIRRCVEEADGLGSASGSDRSDASAPPVTIP